MRAMLLAAGLFASFGCTSSVGGEGGGGAGTTTTTASGGNAQCNPEGCTDAEYCRLKVTGDGTVSCSGLEGLCMPRPESCDGVYEPVCAWDGKVYDSACSAQAQGVDISPHDKSESPCPSSLTPSHYIPCGAIYCNPSVSYCNATWGDMCDVSWRCVPMPAECAAAPSCACLDQAEQYGSHTCEEVQGNGVSGLRIDDSAT